MEEQRKFTAKKNKNNLINISSEIGDVKREGKYICNIWLAAVTVIEAKALIKVLKETLEG